MPKTNKHIEIIVTSLGDGLNSMSLKSRTMIKKVLQKHYSRVGISVVNNAADLAAVAAKNPDLAFIGVKKIPVNGINSPSEDFLWVAEYLEQNGITTTGSGSDAIRLEQDKTQAKDIVMAAGLATSPYFVAKKGQYSDEAQLPLKFPMFIKPPDMGAGAGIDDDSVVRNFKEYESKINSLCSDNRSKALVEEYLFGREFTVALMLDTERKNIMVMPIQQLPLANGRGDAVIGQAMKESATETAVSIVEESVLKQSVMKLAKDVFIALGARDYGRIDMRLDENNVPNFLEANLIPGLIDGSGNFQKACQMNLGMKYEDMIQHIVALAFARELSSELVIPETGTTVLEYQAA